MKIKWWIASLLVFLIFFSLVPKEQSIAQEGTKSDKTLYSKLIVHYQESSDTNQDWSLWVWPEGGEGAVHAFNEKDEFGEIAEVKLEDAHDKIGFIVRTDTWEKDGGDRWAEVEAGVAEVWVKAGDDTVYTSPPDGEYRDFPSFNELDLTVHYSRYDNNYQGWNLWTWTGDNEGKSVEFTEEDEYGKVAHMSLSSEEAFKEVGLIVRKSTEDNEWDEQEFGDRMIRQLNEDGTAEIWLVQGEAGIYYDPNYIDHTPRITRAAIDGMKEITLTTNFPVDTTAGNLGIRLNEGLVIESIEPFDKEKTLTNKLVITTKQNIDLTKSYRVTMDNFGEKAIVAGNVVRSKAFDEIYFYDGNDLGNTYTKEQTDFRVWAPTASEAKVVTYDSWDETEGTEMDMTRAENGTWTLSLPDDQNGLLYTYKVKIGDEWREAVDPYVRATSVNGDKGAVIDLDETDPQDWENSKVFKASKNPEDAVIYELHVRDLSIQDKSGIEQKGKYLGVAELDTTGPDNVNTGLIHIKDLGVTHVQFLPIYDYRTVDETKLDIPQFNWGYDPKNYNVPEGSYSTNPYEPTVRIKELKTMIQTLHEQHLGVIMDVVYNHMFSVNESNFNQLVPGYYFRYNEDGTLANGSGVGNDTASERKMMKKFIVDSVTYWAEEYNMNGFRFDLMGIHDTDTMNEVRTALDEIDPSIIVLGEGWDLNTPLDPKEKANQKNAADMPGIGHFNDVFRDGVKGSVFEDADPGFINGKQNTKEMMEQSIAAGLSYDDTIATYRDPEQVIQYVEAHDNLTLWDKLLYTNPKATLSQRKAMHKLGSSILLTSQGVPFIHAGQEFMRTKYGDHNSYQSPDAINQLDWERRAAFDTEVEYMKGLIELRKKYNSFRLTSGKEIDDRLRFVDGPENTIAYVLQEKKNRHLFVVHNANNANNESVNVNLPGKGPWKVLVNSVEAGTKILSIEKGKTIEVEPLSTMVLLKNGKLK